MTPEELGELVGEPFWSELPRGHWAYPVGAEYAIVGAEGEVIGIFRASKHDAPRSRGEALLRLLNNLAHSHT